MQYTGGSEQVSLYAPLLLSTLLSENSKALILPSFPLTIDQFMEGV